MNIPVIGITGSVGKTSTKEMVAQVLSEKFNVLKTEENYNNEIGIPLTLLRVRNEHQAAVIEMGIDSFGEMTREAKIAKPEICIITNIGWCHLENLKNREGILKAKTEMFDQMPSRAPAFLNGDDDMLATINTSRGVTPIFFGIDNKDAKVYATNIENHGEAGTDFVLHYEEEEIKVKINVPGKHMVYNALAAACTGIQLGLSLEEIASGISKMRTIAGRSNFIAHKNFRIIDDCYNANPVSMKASLEVLSTCAGRRVAVLGDMGDLGDDEDRLHYEVGTFAASHLDVLFACGPLSEHLVQGCRAAGKTQDVYYFKTKAEMLGFLSPFIKKEDTILVKASHFMEFGDVVEALEKM